MTDRQQAMEWLVEHLEAAVADRLHQINGADFMAALGLRRDAPAADGPLLGTKAVGQAARAAAEALLASVPRQDVPILLNRRPAAAPNPLSYADVKRLLDDVSNQLLTITWQSADGGTGGTLFPNGTINITDGARVEALFTGAA